MYKTPSIYVRITVWYMRCIRAYVCVHVRLCVCLYSFQIHISGLEISPRVCARVHVMCTRAHMCVGANVAALRLRALHAAVDLRVRRLAGVLRCVGVQRGHQRLEHRVGQRPGLRMRRLSGPAACHTADALGRCPMRRGHCAAAPPMMPRACGCACAPASVLVGADVRVSMYSYEQASHLYMHYMLIAINRCLDNPRSICRSPFGTCAAYAIYIYI
jgi:hypothetical protein